MCLKKELILKKTQHYPPGTMLGKTYYKVFIF